MLAFASPSIIDFSPLLRLVPSFLSPTRLGQHMRLRLAPPIKIISSTSTSKLLPPPPLLDYSSAELTYTSTRTFALTVHEESFLGVRTVPLYGYGRPNGRSCDGNGQPSTVR